MKTHSAAILAILLISALTVAAYPEETALPPAPKGYTWQRCPEIKGAFLRPDGWHFKMEKQDDKLGYFITKEKIGEDKLFTTGLSVNVRFNIPKQNSMSPYDFALFIRESAREEVKFKKEWNHDMGPFRSVGFLYSRDDKAGAYTVHNILIANDKTGTLYFIMFEGPSAEWDALWKIGEPMLKTMLIDDVI